MTMEGDLVLVTMDNEPTFFARIEEISGDLKPEWFQVKLLVLQVPLMVTTWILREPYINGEEFTMGGRPIRLTRVVAPEPPAELEEKSEPAALPKEPAKKSGAAAEGGSKVLSLTDRLKKK